MFKFMCVHQRAAAQALAGLAHMPTAAALTNLCQPVQPWPPALQFLQAASAQQPFSGQPGRKRLTSAAGDASRQPGVLSVQQHESECWNCQHHMKRGSFACQGCEKIQPVDPSLNYFELLAMPNMHFDLDLRRLERQYKLLQWSLHPDKVVQRPAEEREHAAQQATLINHAYSILRHPLSRANYILSLKGIQSGDTFEGTIDDKELLMEILEAREEVEDTDDAVVLRQILLKNQKEQAELVGKVSEMFEQKAFAEAVPVITHLTYLVKLEHEIVGKMPHQL